jgi:hypothetical protein
MINFIIKWSIAAIPAAIILFVWVLYSMVFSTFAETSVSDRRNFCTHYCSHRF